MRRDRQADRDRHMDRQIEEQTYIKKTAKLLKLNVHGNCQKRMSSVPGFPKDRAKIMPVKWTPAMPWPGPATGH